MEILSNRCLKRSLEFQQKCPKCGKVFDNKTTPHIFPNFACKNPHYYCKI